MIERLRLLFPEMYFAVTATTRKRRPGEMDGVHYFFMDREKFEENLEDGEFLESAVVYDHHYGVPKAPIRHALSRGQDVVVKVDVQGAATIRQIVPNGTFVFLAPESMPELLRRLKDRKTDDPDVLMERFNAASRELRCAHDFDYVVFNETERVDAALYNLSAIINAERCKIVQEDVLL